MHREGLPLALLVGLAEPGKTSYQEERELKEKAQLRPQLSVSAVSGHA